MGEVWRATDTRLGRSVAVKILPGELSANAMLRARFEREARTISQLNHPHICSLFDVGENYLVMELLDGETLADRIARGALPLPAVLDIGAQIADALDRAHRAGIVHRDLKPGNIMLTKSGAKLLDFGLAKSGGVQAIDPTMATEAKPLTQEGTIVGTFQYMAPEQLEGLDADARTDIFALGAVLYEMATGRRAFTGTSKTSLIAAIVGGEPPPISTIQPLTPPAFEHVVQKCLAKERDARWQSAHDVAEELRWIGDAGSQAGVAGPVVAKRRQRERRTWLLAMLAIAAAVAAVAWFAATRWMRAHEHPRLYRLTISTPPGSVVAYGSGRPALSPDGRLIAYAAYSRDGNTLLIRNLSETEWRSPAGTAGATAPFWSPDSRYVAFFARGSLWKIAAEGSAAPEEITKCQRAPGMQVGTWGRDGTILFFSGSALYRVSSAGGEPAEVHVLPPKAIGSSLDFLPDGRHFLCAIADLAAQNVVHYVVSLDPKEPMKMLVRGDADADYADGYFFFVRGGTLYAQPFDVGKLALSGAPKAIAPVQSYDIEGSNFSVAGSTLVYLPQGSENRTELQRADRSGKVLATIAPAAFYFSPRVSHDGRHIAVDQSITTGPGDIWIFDVGSGAGRRFTFDPANESAPIWSPNDAEIVYFIDARAKEFLMRKPVGGGQPSLLFDATWSAFAGDWSPDGKLILAVTISRPGEPFGLTAISTAGAKPWPLGTLGMSPHFSPDGRWFVYSSTEGSRNGESDVFVQPFPPNGSKWQVSAGGGATPVWRRDGNAIYFINPTGKLMESIVSTGADGSFSSQAPQPLFGVALREGASALAQYDLFPDGTFLLNRIPDTTTTPLTVVLNWKEALAR